jgi:hypothetical protein
MNPLQVRSPRASLWPSAQGRLLLGAAAVAVLLLSFYVHLLHESMALGEQLRERQRTASAAHTMTARAAAKPSPVGLVQTRDAADTSRNAQR